jgi:hypothetical protein
MTREHRLVVSLDEISGVRWQCRACGVAISYQLDQSIRLPAACVSCHEPLGESGAELPQMQAFVDALKATLRAQRGATVGATLKLELIETER